MKTQAISSKISAFHFMANYATWWINLGLLTLMDLMRNWKKKEKKIH